MLISKGQIIDKLSKPTAPKTMNQMLYQCISLCMYLPASAHSKHGNLKACRLPVGNGVLGLSGMAANADSLIGIGAGC